MLLHMLDKAAHLSQGPRWADDQTFRGSVHVLMFQGCSSKMHVAKLQACNATPLVAAVMVERGTRTMQDSSALLVRSSTGIDQQGFPVASWQQSPGARPYHRRRRAAAQAVAIISEHCKLSALMSLAGA